ncbi:hypothetical protein GCM10012275_36120 [Longimycelium tulufanense]|uniref:Lipoprotein n=1 Tax=Longimycelium tulufanense TaxID=907463 RepID=A0A8J3FVA9_9PSEU|nr:hypothetical protein GCM10012275_36120 [Longimycelium tulufanense]
MSVVTGLAVSAALTAAAGPAAAATGAQLHGDDVVVPVTGGSATVRPTTLAVTARTNDGAEMTLSAPADGDLGPATSPRRDGGKVHWSYPAKGWDVTAATVDGRLAVTIRAAKDGALAWPVTGTDPATTTVAFTRGEGRSVPVDDPFWNSDRAALDGTEFDMVGQLTMPFWGHRIGERGVSYIVPTDIGTSLRFLSDDGRLQTRAKHEFTSDTRDYTVTFALTDSSPVAPATDYRRYLSAQGGLSTLRDKIRKNPEVGKLLGAFHAYTWGKARDPEAVRQLRDFGISRMWLGYDADGAPMSPEAVAAANNAGYLVGPYDTWANAQDPKNADTLASVWRDPLWPEGCVRDSDHNPVTGFGDRGCYLSSQALAQAEPTRHNLADRVRTMTANGATSYFLDVDAAGELFDDHTPTHRMSKAQDRKNRLDRMRWLAEDRKLVLGSESAGGWANPVVSYSHGSATPVDNRFWELQRDRKTWGGYFPKDRPGFFFKPVSLPADLAKTMFDPTYRVPLYQTVLHDSVISLDRWELSYGKLPDQATTRTLLAMLYNTPLNLVLDGKEIEEQGSRIAELQRFFAPLHEKAGTEPMTGFRWVTADHLVQQTTFGEGTLTVTANFGTDTVQGLPGGCVDATIKGDKEPRRLCPGQ